LASDQEFQVQVLTRAQKNHSYYINGFYFLTEDIKKTFYPIFYRIIC